MSKFFVISGYCGPDSYTCSNGPILSLNVFATAEAVEKAYMAFLETAYGEDDTQQTFRVIEGVERFLEPVIKATEYKLETRK